MLLNRENKENRQVVLTIQVEQSAWEKALDGPQNYDLNTTDTLAYTSGMYNAPDPDHESQNLDMKGGAAHV